MKLNVFNFKKKKIGKQNLRKIEKTKTHTNFLGRKCYKKGKIFNFVNEKVFSVKKFHN